MTSVSLMQDICNVLYERKGKDIISIDIANSSVMCDYFVICSAKSTTQVKAMCDHVIDSMEEKYGLLPKSKEGFGEGRWVVLDYFDVVVHLFCDETRLFYHIERLWSSEENVIVYQPPVEVSNKKSATAKPKTAAKTADKAVVKPNTATKTAEKAAVKPKTAAKTADKAAAKPKTSAKTATSAKPKTGEAEKAGAKVTAAKKAASKPSTKTE